MTSRDHNKGRAMRSLTAALLFIAIGASGARAQGSNAVDPAADLHTFQAYFKQRFPALPIAEFANGPYAMDKGMRKQWEEIMQFPPYDFALDEGKTLFETPFKNGKTYGDCFPNKGIGIRQTYPQFDTASGEVMTLDLAINKCRQTNGEAPLKYQVGPIASIAAYMASTSDGKPFDIKIPADPRALAAYENGKKYFYTRRGQLNFSCASCHVEAAGRRLRGDILAPALGILASFPIYRSDWGSMGTIDRRFISCNLQTRAVPLKPEAKEYRDLEYYLSYMSNGVPIAGPGTRP